MAEKDFVVKNGLVVNGAITVNSAGIYSSSDLVVNSTFFVGQANTVNASYVATISANNASYLGGVQASAYVNTTGNYTISGNLNLTGSNVYFNSGLKIGSEVIANSTTIFVGNASTNAYINSTGIYVDGALYESAAGGGYYKGNDGPVGNTSNKANLYRINSNTQSNNVTIVAGENALTAGPMVIASGYNLTIETGGRVVIV